MDKCEALLAIAIHVRGTHAVDGSYHRLTEAIEVADCCRQKERFDLATELLDQVESFPLGKQEPFACLVKELRSKIASSDTSGSDVSIDIPEQELPSLLIRGWNFARAMARWTAQGWPMCTREQIEQRLSICQACEHLQDDHCVLCGCACTESNMAINKLTIATESCPIKKWMAVKE